MLPTQQTNAHSGAQIIFVGEEDKPIPYSDAFMEGYARGKYRGFAAGYALGVSDERLRAKGYPIPYK